MVAASVQSFPLADLPEEARKNYARSHSKSSSSTATPRSSERDLDFGGLTPDEDDSKLDADVPRLLSKSSSSTATPRSSERDSDFCATSTSTLASDEDDSELDADAPPDEDDSKLDADVPRLLERMNSASDEVNRLEGLAAEARARYGRRLLRFKRLYASMRGRHGVAFDAAKPLFRDASGWAALRAAVGGPAAEVLAASFGALQRHQAGLAREQELIDRLSRRGRAAKDVYFASMRRLEAISEEEHARRRSPLGATKVVLVV